ncbi:hypothetical protein QE152_g40490 [Popillia japonica]|uniref:Uncharacterized protein n=1 Tax=Popillia japonica TaxID=7064 RepID=A0AAW1HFT7_POPJA
MNPKIESERQTEWNDDGAENIDPFQRRDSISRTPPRKGKAEERESTRKVEEKELHTILRREDALCRRASFPDVRDLEAAENIPRDRALSLSQAESGRRSRRTVDEKTPVYRNTENISTSDGENSGWQDEEMAISPIFKLYETQDKSNVQANNETQDKSNVQANSPVKKKRKRECKPAENVKESGLSKEMWDVLKSMTQVNNKTEELKNLVKESTKTKTEIKIATRSLVNIVSNLSRRIDTLKVHYEILLDKVDAQQKPKHDSIQEQGRLPLTKVTSVGVQAEENEIAQEMQHKNAEAISQIECELNEKTGWDGLAKIIDHNWPASCYKNTVTVDRKVIRERKGDVAVVVSPNSPTSGQALEQIKTNFPEALPLLEENLEEGRIEYVKTKTETILSKGSKGETSRVLYMLPYAIDPAGINDLRKLYDTIGQLKEAMAEQNTKKIKLVALGNLDSDYMRKCAEHIYRGTTNMIEIVTNKQISSGKKETQQLEKMVIRSEGKQYADILRTIKSSVDIDKVGIKIKSIKKTTKGDVMLEIQGGADKAEALKRGILNKSQGTRVEMKNKEETFYVTGIDGDVCSRVISKAYKDSTKRLGRSTNTPYWWNDTVEEKRKTCSKTRRQLTRVARVQERDEQKIVEARAEQHTRLRRET